MVFRYTRLGEGGLGIAMNAHCCLTRLNDLGEIGALKDIVADVCEEANLGGDLAHQLTLLLEALASNVINHGCDEGADLTLQAPLSRDDSEVTTVIEDEGRALSPLPAPRPVLEGNADARPVGGIGFHLVENLVDDIAYAHGGARNGVTMTISIVA